MSQRVLQINELANPVSSYLLVDYSGSLVSFATTYRTLEVKFPLLARVVLRTDEVVCDQDIRLSSLSTPI